MDITQNTMYQLAITEVLARSAQCKSYRSQNSNTDT